MGRPAAVSVLSGELLDERPALTLEELSRRSGVSAESLVELVELGVVEPKGEGPDAWRFQLISLSRISLALRLEQDLGVNPAGAALAMDLLEELRFLRERLQRLKG